MVLRGSATAADAGVRAATQSTKTPLLASSFEKEITPHAAVVHRLGCAMFPPVKRILFDIAPTAIQYFIRQASFSAVLVQSPW
jgi:hypothetical protein